MVKLGFGAALRAPRLRLLPSTALASAALLVLVPPPAAAQPVWQGPGADFNIGAN